MSPDGRDCGPLYGVYAAARDGDVDAMQVAWERARPTLERDADRLDGAVEGGRVDAVEAEVAAMLFVDEETPTLIGPLPRLAGTLLFAFGYVASYVLFFRASTPEAVVDRLRWAYRTVGVSIRDTESVAGAERTVFRCPYRTLGAGRYGTRRVCHDVLDLVDDGYVRWLARHREIDYDRPRACTASECCYSVVSER